MVRLDLLDSVNVCFAQQATNCLFCPPDCTLHILRGISDILGPTCPASQPSAYYNIHT